MNKRDGKHPPYDLEERTLLFSKELICVLKRLPKNTINFKLIDQTIRAGTSVGANYLSAFLEKSK